MKDAMTYAHEAGFFSFNVVGWKAEFERLIKAVRAEYEAPLRLAEEALNAMLTHMGMDEDEWTKPTFNQAREALAAILEALAEPVKHESVMDYEHICALRESEQIQAGDSYFFVRPENDTPTSRKMFFQGFERGFHKGLKYAAQVSAKREWADLTDDEIWDCDVNTANARRVIAAFKEKNK